MQQRAVTDYPPTWSPEQVRIIQEHITRAGRLTDLAKEIAARWAVGQETYATYQRAEETAELARADLRRLLEEPKASASA